MSYFKARLPLYIRLVKNMLHIALLLLFLLPQVSNTFVWFNYALNKAAITEEFCVNKAKPELKCNGKCHLAEQLTETAPTQPNTPTEVVYLPQLDLFFDFSELEEVLASVEIAPNGNPTNLYSFTLNTVIDQPPRA